MIRRDKIGEGTYGRVYSAERGKEDGSYAVKRNLIDKEIDFAGSVRELDLLTKLQDHPHIVRIEFMSVGDPFAKGCMSPLRDRKYKDDKVHFIFALADRDLDDIIMKSNYGMKKAQKYMVDILLAVEYMHSKSVIHRDLKPQNILDFDGTLQICDFGLSKHFSKQSRQSTNVVTAWYRAPEICMGHEDYDEKSDVWSVGCILYEIVSKKSFVRDIKDANRRIIDKIVSGLPYQISPTEFSKLSSGTSFSNMKPRNKKYRDSWGKQLFGRRKCEGIDREGFVEIIDRMLKFNPSDRLSIRQVLDHPFFDMHRSYINKVRENYPPERDPYENVRVIACNERNWGIKIAQTIFKSRDSFPWYDHGLLFQAIDIFDRYLLYLAHNNRAKNQNNTRGLYLTKYRARLSFLVCLYLALKYYSAGKYPVSYKDITEDTFKTDKSLKIADELETTLIKDVLEYEIYRPTIYDTGSWKYSDDEVESLLRLVQKQDELDQKLNVKEASKEFEKVLKNKKK